MAANQKFISVVIPVFNSAATIEHLVKQLCDYFKTETTLENSEIILVDDNSDKDISNSICKKLSTVNSKVKFISLFKNFGQIAAILTGFRFAKGKYIIVMDDDLQHSVDDIPLLLNCLINNNYDFVYGVAENKSHHILRRFASHLNERLVNALWKKPKHLKISSFIAMKKELMEEVIKYEGPYPYLSGLIFRVSHNGGNVITKHYPRAKGKSQYNLYKLLKLSLNGATNFSLLPLRIAMIIGLMFSSAGIILGAVIFFAKVFGYPFSYGWASVICTLLFSFGIQFLCIWMLGEYLGRMFLHQNKTPQAAIKEIIDHEKEDNNDINHGSNGVCRALPSARIVK